MLGALERTRVCFAAPVALLPLLLVGERTCSLGARERALEMGEKHESAVLVERECVIGLISWLRVVAVLV